ncbi:hypothetical protein J6590_070445 [Homalodisca vitripennis]|nr:hypothetical protein J6590_070445 [Homalodisca vitripennis]
MIYFAVKLLFTLLERDLEGLWDILVVLWKLLACRWWNLGSHGSWRHRIHSSRLMRPSSCNPLKISVPETGLLEYMLEDHPKYLIAGTLYTVGASEVQEVWILRGFRFLDVSIF